MLIVKVTYYTGLNSALVAGAFEGGSREQILDSKLKEIQFV